MRKEFIFLISIAVLLTFTSCSSKPIYEKKYEFNDLSWDRFNKLKFEAVLEKGKYNLFIYVKNTEAFNYETLPVFISISNNDGEERYREISLLMKDDEGEPIGIRTDNTVETTISFFENYELKKAGRLSVSFEKMIPKVVTSGIAEVGLIIEKSR